MYDFLTILLFIVIGASIGWVTNKLAIWFLFNPKKPKKLLFFTIQGVFPKRQNIIAQRFSTIFVEEFLTPEMIQKHLFSSQNMESIYELIEENLTQFLEVNLKESYPILSMFISSKKKENFKKEVLAMASEKISDTSINFKDNVSKIIDIQKVIEDKINDLDSDKINEIMNSILNKELKFIEISGLILGGIIGLLQGIIAVVL